VFLVSRWLAGNLAAYEQTNNTQIPIIWDPVMFTTSEHAVISGEHQTNVGAYLHLAKQVTLLTPNYNELMVLAGTFEGKGQTEQLALDHLAQLVETDVLVTVGDSHNRQKCLSSGLRSSTKTGSSDESINGFFR
jgi:hydroxymethylpyrimidine/phosphomethylpyrimidine kinase